MSFVTLNEDQARELYRLWRYYMDEARRCEKAKAHLAGCSMVAAALEAMLMLMVDAHPHILKNMKGVSKKPLIDWNLGQLIAVAKTADWLPGALDPKTDEWSGEEAKIGDYAELCRMIRNLIHPGNYVTNHFQNSVTAEYLEQQFETLEVCAEWLEEHNARGLQEMMRAEGIEVGSE